MRAGIRNSDGFTYISLLILIAVLGITSTASVTLGAIMQRRAQEEELLHIGQQFRLAFKRYYEATPVGRRPYPSVLQDLVRDNRFPDMRRHLRRNFIDPLTGREDWGVIPAPGGGIAGVFSLSEARPIKIGQFDLEFKDFEGKEKYSEWVFGYMPFSAPMGKNLEKTGKGLR